MSEGWNNAARGRRDDFENELLADAHLTANELVLDERAARDIDDEVRPEASDVDTGIRFASPKFSDRLAGNDVNGCMVEQRSRRRCRPEPATGRGGELKLTVVGIEGVRSGVGSFNLTDQFMTGDQPHLATEMLRKTS